MPDAPIATTSVYQWVDTGLLQNNSQPSKSVGVLFLVEFVTFLVFLTCLGLRTMESVVAQQSLLTQQALSEAVLFSSTEGLAGASDLRRYVLDAFVSNTPVLATQRQIGATWITQQRSAHALCYFGQTAFDCLTDAVESGYQTFEGPLASRSIIAYDAAASCPSIACNPGFRAQTLRFYVDAGPTVLIYNGSLYANESLGSALTLATNATADVVASLLDRFTRFVSIKSVVLDSGGTVLTLFGVCFELPVAGGLNAWVSGQSVLAKPTARSRAYSAVIWFYCAAFLAVTALRSVLGVLRRENCVACRSSTVGFCATSCSSCGKPICLDLTETTKCSWCGVTQQPVPHSCWRTQLDPTRIVPLSNIALIILASVWQASALDQVGERVAAVLRGAQQADGRVPLLDVSAAMDQLDRVLTLNAFNVLVAFVCVYRFLGRASWVATFLRVFSSGGFLMGYFFLGFCAVFFGFMFAFHLLIGESTTAFATLPGTFAGTFQLLLGLLDWTGVSPALFSTSFTALYLFFCWVCVLVMVNVLISLVTTEYKRARKVKAFDSEAASCFLLFSRKAQGGADASVGGGGSGATDKPKAPIGDGGAAEEEETVNDLNKLEHTTLPLIRSLRTNVDQVESSCDSFGRDTLRKTIARLDHLAAIAAALAPLESRHTSLPDAS